MSELGNALATVLLEGKWAPDHGFPVDANNKRVAPGMQFQYTSDGSMFCVIDPYRNHHVTGLLSDDRGNPAKRMGIEYDHFIKIINAGELRCIDSPDGS